MAEKKVEVLKSKHKSVTVLVGGQLKDITASQLNELYNADPVLEPELQGLTYAQVMVKRQVAMAASGDGHAFDRVADRVEGKPKQVTENFNMNMSYQEFLEGIPDDVEQADT